jgi:hypothetical protein
MDGLASGLPGLSCIGSFPSPVSDIAKQVVREWRCPSGSDVGDAEVKIRAQPTKLFATYS